jgi:hypothetical protein
LIEALLIAALMIGSSSCKSRPAESVSKTYAQLIKLDLAYQEATEKRNRAPSNLDDLLPYLKKQGDPAELLRSDNDQENFLIVWGVDLREFSKRGQPPPITACEASGKGGKRYVLRARQIFQMSDEEIRQLPLPTGFKSPI